MFKPYLETQKWRNQVSQQTVTCWVSSQTEGFSKINFPHVTTCVRDKKLLLWKIIAVIYNNNHNFAWFVTTEIRLSNLLGLEIK